MAAGLYNFALGAAEKRVGSTYEPDDLRLAPISNRSASGYSFLLFRLHDFFDIQGAVELIDLFLGKQEVFQAVYLHSARLGKQAVHQ